MSLWRQVCRIASQSEGGLVHGQRELTSLAAWQSAAAASSGPSSSRCARLPQAAASGPAAYSASFSSSSSCSSGCLRADHPPAASPSSGISSWPGPGLGLGPRVPPSSLPHSAWSGSSSSGGCGNRSSGTAALQRRGFATIEEPEGEEEPHSVDMSNPKLVRLRDQILELNMLEVADLTTILCARLGIDVREISGGGGGAPAAAAPAAAPEPPKVEEKTEFDVKLTGYEAAAKVKVIKEVRAVLPELGLKEAKELVEKAPCMIKPGLKKEEAEALKQKLEKVGGKVELE